MNSEEQNEVPVIFKRKFRRTLVRCCMNFGRGITGPDFTSLFIFIEADFLV
jgi:hypothetical protein